MKPYTWEMVLEAAGNVFKGESDSALKTLAQYGSGKEVARVSLAILKLSNGNLEKLQHYVNLANIDYRDVLLEAEYESGGPGSSDVRLLEDPYRDLFR